MKILRQTAFLGAAALVFGAAAFAAPNTNTQLNELRGLQMSNSKIPILNQGRLQMVIFSHLAERRGESLIGFDTVLAVIRKDADSDAIRDDWKLTLYPLDATLPQILDFWKRRIVYCEAIMSTPEAEIDSVGRRASGNRDVHFRSPLMDLDGIGFEAEFDRRTILINSQVRIVLRQKSSDPEELLKDPKKTPGKYEPVIAVADSMQFDAKQNEATLLGNVKVIEEQGILTCDRLTVFWGSDSKEKEKQSSGGTPAEMSVHGSGIDRVLADGNVVIVKRSNPKERIVADHMIYEAAKRTITFSGDDRQPRIESAKGETINGGEIFFELDTNRGNITGGCRIEDVPQKNDKGEPVARKLTSDSCFFDGGNNFADFVGHVRIRDGEQSVSCERARFALTDGKNGAAAPRRNANKPNPESILGSADLGIGSKELKSADFNSYVVIQSADGSRISCDNMRADFAVAGEARNIKSADCRGHVRMTDASKNRLRCEEMHAEFAPGGTELKSADCRGGVKLTDSSKNTLICDSMYAEFAAGSSRSIKRADCRGGVKLTDSSGNKLDCDEMHSEMDKTASGSIDLAEAECFGNVRVESAGGEGSPAGVITSNYCHFDNRNDHVVFKNNVRGKREKATLKCDRLDVFLGRKRDAAAKTSPGSIAIGAGGDRVIRKTVAAGKTKVTDESGTLDCDKLTLFFSELPPGAKPEPGMFQSGGARLTDILAEGHVVAVNHASADSKQQPGILSGKSNGARVLRADYCRADLTRHLSHFRGNVNVNDDENALRCEDMYLYGVRRLTPTAAATAAAKKAAEEDPDADPFALPGFNEDSVPTAINITDDVQLKKILCLGDVVLKRTDPDTKRIQEAGGGRCVYMPELRVATLTDTPPNRPWVRAEGRQQYGSRIVYDLNENIFKSYDTDSFTIEPNAPTP